LLILASLAKLFMPITTIRIGPSSDSYLEEEKKNERGRKGETKRYLEECGMRKEEKLLERN